MKKLKKSTTKSNNTFSLNDYISHSRNREYMSGVERDKYRIKQTNEVFTPTYLVHEMLDQIEKEDPYMFSDVTRVILDNSCGDGQFLSEIVIRKIERSNCTLEEALKFTYGIDLMKDNIKECKNRLAGPHPSKEILEILDENIVKHNSLTWDFKNWCSTIVKPAKELFR